MKASRYATTRQKACLRCSAAKVKCDRKAGRCSRCVSKDLACAYARSPSSRSSAHTASGSTAIHQTSPMLTANDGSSTSHPISVAGCHSPAEADSQDSLDLSALSMTNISASSTLDRGETPSGQHMLNSTPSSGLYNTEWYADLEVCCPIDADAIRNRWLNSFLLAPGQKTKEYSASITAFIYRMLKAYAATAVHGRGVPPFVHDLQTTSTSTSQPLLTCMTLVRMCENPLPGSENVATEVLQREMSNIFKQYDNHHGADPLPAFQAYLIYSMVLFFHLGQSQQPFLRQAMMNLQHLACATSHRGLMCIAEQQHARPRWEAWILVEAKRRTLYTMYLFDSVLSAQDGLPTALGTELTGLPAPAMRQLWRAQSRTEWEAAYNVHLADVVQSLRIDELWPMPEGLDDSGVRERRRRIDQWLQGIDEYGTMLYAVTSCTHGS